MSLTLGLAYARPYVLLLYLLSHCSLRLLLVVVFETDSTFTNRYIEPSRVVPRPFREKSYKAGNSPYSSQFGKTAQWISPRLERKRVLLVPSVAWIF